jgi:hypothetical protein
MPGSTKRKRPLSTSSPQGIGGKKSHTSQTSPTSLDALGLDGIAVQHAVEDRPVSLAIHTSADRGHASRSLPASRACHADDDGAAKSMAAVPSKQPSHGPKQPSHGPKHPSQGSSHPSQGPKSSSSHTVSASSVPEGTTVHGSVRAPATVPIAVGSTRDIASHTVANAPKASAVDDTTKLRAVGGIDASTSSVLEGTRMSSMSAPTPPDRGSTLHDTFPEPSDTASVDNVGGDCHPPPLQCLTDGAYLAAMDTALLACADVMELTMRRMTAVSTPGPVLNLECLERFKNIPMSTRHCDFRRVVGLRFLVADMASMAELERHCDTKVHPVADLVASTKLPIWDTGFLTENNCMLPC